MNSYNIFIQEEPATILYHAIATDTNHVKQLATDAGINISDCIIELERSNIKNELGKSYQAQIKNAVI